MVKRLRERIRRFFFNDSSLRKSLLRLLLAVTVLFYLSGSWYAPDTRREAQSKKTQSDRDNGMGGGVAPGVLAVHPGVDLEISGIPEPEEYGRPQMLTFSTYTLVKGDIIGNIAERTGLNEDTLISVNNVKNTRLMQIGQVIRIPNQDGIYYSVKSGETLDSIAGKYKTTAAAIATVNELFSDSLEPNTSLFIPGARMDWINRQEINGDLFIWPCAGYITSHYGYRLSPFDNTSREFHSGLDIGAPQGSSVRAAMAGRVSQVGYDDSIGNYVVVSHHSGYRTQYGHMSVVRVKAGAYVDTGQKIGDVGSTGRTTGPHIHFTVYKNGVTVNPRALIK